MNSFMHWLAKSLAHPTTSSFIYSLLPSFLHSFTPSSFLHSFTPSFLPSFIPSLLHTSISWFIPSFHPSFLHSFIHHAIHSCHLCAHLPTDGLSPSFFLALMPLQVEPGYCCSTGIECLLEGTAVAGNNWYNVILCFSITAAIFPNQFNIASYHAKQT